MATEESSLRRNILLIIADDLGKNVGCYGAELPKTPNIDKLASEGTIFDMAFTSTASCSASRTVIYTGLHPHENGQYGLQGGASHFQSFDHVESAPRLFNALSYQTGIIGKVHVGPPAVFPWGVREESESRDVVWVAERGEVFFEEAKQTQRPFFLTVGYIDPHRDITTRGGWGNAETCGGKFVPHAVSPDEVIIPEWLTDLPESRAEYVEYYKSIMRLDFGVGLLLAALERQDFADSTLVVLCSDNGPPFVNSKTTLYDAGVRLPFIVRRPSAPNVGNTNPNMISYIDILPTLLDWAGAPLNFSSPPSVPDGQVLTRETRGGPVAKRLGRSFLSIAHCSEILPENQWQHTVFGSHTFHEIVNYYPTRFLRDRIFKYHRNIAWRLDFPFASDLYASLTLEAIRKNKKGAKDGDIMIGPRSLKQYIRRPPEELFDLESDPQEIDNLAGREEFEETLTKMRDMLEQWQLKTNDPWLFRDGQSISAIKRYVGQDLRLPDKFDFVLDDFRSEDLESFNAHNRTLSDQNNDESL